MDRTEIPKPTPLSPFGANTAPPPNTSLVVAIQLALSIH